MSCGVYFLCRQHGEMPFWRLFDSLSLIFSSKKMCTHSAKLLLAYKRRFSPCILILLHLPSYFPVFPLAEADLATTAVPTKKTPNSTALWNFIYKRKGGGGKQWGHFKHLRLIEPYELSRWKRGSPLSSLPVCLNGWVPRLHIHEAHSFQSDQ